MADVAAADQREDAPKRSKKPLFLGLALAILGGGAAFYATWSGLVGGGGEGQSTQAQPLPDIRFIPLDPVVVSISTTAGMRQVRFTAQLEVDSTFAEEVGQLHPRILDVLNGYLRVVEPARFEDPASLLIIRAQLLRRIQIVTGEGRVRDLLVTEFIVQ